MAQRDFRAYPEIGIYACRPRIAKLPFDARPGPVRTLIIRACGYSPGSGDRSKIGNELDGEEDPEHRLRVNTVSTRVDEVVIAAVNPTVGVIDGNGFTRVCRMTTGGWFPLLMLFVTLLLAFAGDTLASETEMGEYRGAILSEKPAWFKESFLEFEEDVAEAAVEGRRVMLYFHQNGCPYCARLVDENFTDPELKTFIIENFDGISLNMWGDRAVVSVGGQDFTEKTFAAALKVQYTPTLIFLDENGRVALRLNGYYPPQDFRAALDYVAQKKERQLSFAEYRLTQLSRADGELIGQDFFIDNGDLSRILADSDRPLAVFFEAADCTECETMHRRILADPATRKLVQQANSVQFNIASRQTITTPGGNKLSVRDWAEQLGISYTPSVVFFDSKDGEVMRIGAFVKTFHFQSVFAYVLEKAYLEEPEFQRYISARAEHIREAGFDTDIWGYESFHD